MRGGRHTGVVALSAVGLATGLAIPNQVSAQSFTAVTPQTLAGQYLGQPAAYRGVAAYDYDGDGRDDLLYTGYSGATRLYRNLGAWRFADETSTLALAARASYTQAVWGDLDGDGDADLVLGGAPGTPSAVLRNDDAGGFTEVSADLPLGSAVYGVSSINLADLDGDGLLDIYLAVLGGPDQLLYNLGDWVFADEADIRAPVDRGVSMGSIATDLDGDGDLDLYLTYDARQSNRLLRNDGTGYFSDDTPRTILGYAGFGMGVDAGDVDGDGMLDLYITNLYENVLFRSGASEYADFVEVGAEAGVADRGMGWGTVIFDANHDGHADIFVANESPFTVDGVAVPNRLFLGIGGGGFESTDDRAASSREADFGAAPGDFDGDGDLDIAIATSGGQGLKLLRNDCPPPENHYVALRQVGPGAQFRAYVNGRAFVDELHAGGGYASQSAGILHVGVGTADQLDSLEVALPGAPVRTYYRVPTSATYELDTDGTLLPFAPGAGGDPKLGDDSASDARFTGARIAEATPNPTATTCTVSLPDDLYEWRLYGPGGSTVARGRRIALPSEITVTLAALPRGAYRFVATSASSGDRYAQTLIRP